MTTVARQKFTSLLLLLALVLLVVFSMTALTLFFKQADIENDLAQRANRLLTVSGLFKGSVSFNGRDAFIEGSVESKKSIAEVVRIVKSVNGVRLVEDALTVKLQQASNTIAPDSTKKIEKPAELKGQFTLKHDSGEWVLVGNVDSESTREDLITSTTEVIGDNIVNLLTVTKDGTSPRWIEKYLQVLERFAYVHGGAELTLDKGILTVGGEVDSEAAMRMTLLPLQETFGEVAKIRNRLRIPKFKGSLFIPQKDHAIEQVDLSGLQFNEANTDVQSTASIDTVISLLKQSPDIYIELAGHINQSADEDKNIEVSLDQALLVRQYMIDHEIKESRLRTNGYGSSRPIDENDTNRNHRIEVTVIR